MESVRRRVPLKATDDDEREEDRILDEQGKFVVKQQEEVIDRLRRDNEASTTQNYLLIQLLIGLSLIAQIMYLFTPSKQTLLANIFPIPVSSSDTPIPLSTLLTLLAILTHFNLLLQCRLPQLLHLARQLSNTPNAIEPISFALTYAVSAVGPTLSLFLGKPWQTTGWWMASLLITYVTQSVVDAIEEGRNGVAEVEGMKYVAPGA